MLRLLRERGGDVTAAEVRAGGRPRVTLARLVQTGEIIRLERGLYRLTDTGGLTPEDAETTDFLKVQLRFP